MKLLIIVALAACGAEPQPQPQPVANAAPAAAPATSGPRTAKLMAGAKPSLVDRAKQNGACYGGSGYGVMHTGLTAAEDRDLKDELAMQRAGDEMVGGYGYSPPPTDESAAKTFPPCAKRAAP